MSNSPAGRPDPASFLDGTVEEARTRFISEKSLLGFHEYLDVVAADPKAQVRDAPTYLRDVFLHYGTEEVERPYGRFRRYKLFDAPFDGGRERLIGHERVQQEVFGLLSDFVKEGRTTKLILLHGPNGSAKTSFIGCIMRALEHYSRLPEGALYTFNWVFPSAKLERTNIGFGTARPLGDLKTYAHLAEGDVDARLRVETRDHPLLLLPVEARLRFLRELLGPKAQLPKNLTEGDLSPKARQIYDALLRAYKGDLSEVLKHVQVERFYISRRYRRAAVTVDPQLRADAGVRQVTADRSLASLPPSLHNVTLYEPMGDLVDGNRGIIEYNDLLKRPPEAFKYLLSTCETGAVRLDTMTLFLDTVFIGSCNAALLHAFKEMPDFASFKARIELVQVPYLIDYQQERLIYAEQTAGPTIHRPCAPHTDEVAALWAVLTRIERPDPTAWEPSVRQAISSLTPLQKAELYALGKAPAELPRDVANHLVSLVPEMYRRHRVADIYEGRFGASPRELKAALLAASRRPEHSCLTPMALFEELEALCNQTSVYEFLRLQTEGDYHRPRAFIETVRQWYLDLVEDELHNAMGLVDRTATTELFARYIDHVLHYVRKEKRHNPVTGQYEEPDEKLMADVERRFGAKPKSAADVRAGIMHRIAAWRMDHPDESLDYDRIFADHMARIDDAFYEEKRKVSDKVKRDLLTFVIEGGERLDDEARTQAEGTLAALERDFGYCRPCAVEVVSYLLKHRTAPA